MHRVRSFLQVFVVFLDFLVVPANVFSNAASADGSYGARAQAHVSTFDDKIEWPFHKGKCGDHSKVYS